MRGNTDDYHVAVPSYRRPYTAGECTLRLLTESGVAPERITLFLDYKEPARVEYHELAAHYGVGMRFDPVKGITQKRVVISQAYAPGTPVVSMDDDVTSLMRAVSPKKLETVGNLDAFIQEAFTATAAEDLYVWGINAVANPFFMRSGYTTNLKFLIGTLWGYFSRPGHRVHDMPGLGVKEDYDSSLRAWWYDGGVLRINDVAAKADHYKLPGGCQEYRTPEVSEQAAAYLEAAWPGLVRRNTRRKSGHAEVLLARKGRTAGHPVSVPPPGLA